ncbi:hypothetical protein Pelo_17791 [Pelomyxa schiedti]|nr:hypothetical protein Pelo_17791 [Pelomyxa schiedti]
MTKTEPFIKPFHWQEQKGIFPSDVLFNLHGRPVITATRRALDTPDVNAFVTLWVMNTLLEAHAIGAINLDQDVVQNAVTAIVDYQDKNYPDNMRQTFWPQKLINGTWVCNPENVLGMCDDMEGFAELVLTVLEDLDILPFIQAMTEIMIEVIEGYRPYFPIPADFDDSFTNVGFGNFLLYLASDFPQAQKAWASANENPATLWEPTLKYSYQPFSSDFNLNSIDPRTYYFAHEFLEQLSKNESFVLPTTWISNIDENRELFYEEVAMPFRMTPSTLKLFLIFPQT